MAFSFFSSFFYDCCCPFSFFFLHAAAGVRIYILDRSHRSTG